MNALIRDIADQACSPLHEGRPPELRIDRYGDTDLIVASRPSGDLTSTAVSQLTALVRDVRQGRERGCKFLVFDLGETAGAAAQPTAPAGLDEMLGEVSDLIVEVPVVTVAWTRGRVAGPDLELAFACSVIAGEPRTRFHFDLDLVSSLRTYSALAHKVGFVRAERMMESGAELDLAQMNDLMLLTTVPSSQGASGIRDFARARSRRHNAACGIYRAQRLTMGIDRGRSPADPR